MNRFLIDRRSSSFAAVWALAASAAFAQANLPELPRVGVDTSLPATPGTVHGVAAGGDLQAALDGAQPGDVVELEAGATFRGVFVLRPKAGAGWIVVRTSAHASLPAPGCRAGPADAASMARIVSPTVEPAFLAVAGAHHWRLVGLEITVDPAASISYCLVRWGEGIETSAASLPHHLIADRCWVHGNPLQAVKRGFEFNCGEAAVIDSTVDDCHNAGQDTQAICGWNGPGPFRIANCRLEGAGENVMFGGATPAIAGLVPSDIEFVGNHVVKPLRWRPGEPGYDGMNWSIKNLFELKNAQRVLIEGNVFENCWAHSQVGFAFVLTPRTEDGAAPWAVVNDVWIRRNLVRRAGSAFGVSGTDNGDPALAVRAERIRVSDNLFDEIDGPRWGGSGWFVLSASGARDVAIVHNTTIQTGSTAVFDVPPKQERFEFADNLALHNLYGVFGSGSGVGTTALNDYCSNWRFAGNALVGGPAGSYPAGNFFPAATADVGFVDEAGRDWRLAAASPLKNAATDGRDVGADLDAVESAAAAATAGNASPGSTGGGTTGGSSGGSSGGGCLNTAGPPTFVPFAFALVVALLRSIRRTQPESAL